jgi:hypothetical protein
MQFQTNIPNSTMSKLDYKLHKKTGHPIKIIKDHIYKYFNDYNKIYIKDYRIHTNKNLNNLSLDENHVAIIKELID